ncbi:DsbE family thiol:disulfide interchange protein [Vibrio sp. SS-MA-C1-2]|uniref:DsbE family thiol:disulfide interchange protein n=1 Tax=Vibrio sp. SS-MA-C1-2 TaxID=2908646 RepID=UPI001F38EE2F|nr:DsbE family thiol:disulfide interchange protein [Vibrio sp. SS-MA-C1-2]UJF18199.1 DsbE family thiol:disulfide interchange protein [Vibrio sp. SS-MA-C1-2]
MNKTKPKGKFALVLVILSLLLLAGLLWFGLTNKSDEQYQPMQGKPVPKFSISSLKDKKIKIDQSIFSQHNWSLLNVWATWCAPCQQEHPYLIELKERRVPIYGLNYRDTPSLANKWLSGKGDPYIATLSDTKGQLGLDFGVYATPETFIIDQSGTILYRYTGVLTEEIWRQHFKPIIQQINSNPKTVN